MVVIKGLAITVGSNPSRSAKIGRVLPTILATSTTSTTTRIYMHLFDDTHLSVVQAVGEAVGINGPGDSMKGKMQE